VKKEDIMITINVDNLPLITAAAASEWTGLDVVNLTQPGLYKVMFTYEGVVSALVYLGQVESFEIPSLEEVKQELITDGLGDAELEHVTAFYDHGMTGYGYEYIITEEDCDFFIRIG
jgi:hypothetical protein